MENVASVFAQEEIKLNFPGSGPTNYISGSTQDKISYHIGESFVGLKIKRGHVGICASGSGNEHLWNRLCCILIYSDSDFHL